jgi:hypothetical protein
MSVPTEEYTALASQLREAVGVAPGEAMLKALEEFHPDPSERRDRLKEAVAQVGHRSSAP